MERRRPKRRKKRASGAFGASCPAAIYVPLIHGVGVRSVCDWAAGSVDKLAEWWLGTGYGGQVEEIGCPTSCRLSESRHHRHL